MFVSWQHPLWFVQSGEICSERGKNVQLLHSFGANYFHQVRNAQLFQKTINRSFFRRESSTRSYCRSRCRRCFYCVSTLIQLFWRCLESNLLPRILVNMIVAAKFDAGSRSSFPAVQFSWPDFYRLLFSYWQFRGALFWQQSNLTISATFYFLLWILQKVSSFYRK